MEARDDGEEKGEGNGNVDDVDGKKGVLSNAEIVSHCITFLLAGYETTANTLSFTSYLLAINPEVQDKLCSEIDNYFESKPVSIKRLENVLNTGMV